MRSHAAELRFARPRLARRAALWALAIVLVLAIGGGIWAALHFTREASRPVRISLPTAQPPLPPPLKEGFLPIDRGKAETINAGIPTSTAPLEPARPFAGMALNTGLLGRQAAVDCLTAAVYYEAASESDHGQRAVAQVVLNRVRHPAFPKSVCGVVYQGSERRTGCQFSFTCDGSLARKPTQAGWYRAQGIAMAALAGFVEPSVGTATHYHTVWVVPYWAWSVDKITTLGAHIFYRWKGYWGKRAAFDGTYAGESAQDETPFIMPGDVISLSDDAVAGGSPPLGPRLMADEAGRLAPPSPSLGTPQTLPRADHESGTLVVDDAPGTPGGDTSIAD